jgi:hypothetical protein
MGSAPVTPSSSNDDGPSLTETAVSILPLAIVAAIAIFGAILLGMQITSIMDMVGSAIPPA